jgi:predicted DNA-binding protein
MIRANYHLTEQQVERLKARSRETGLSVAELIRRAVDAYLAKSEKSRKGKP